MSVQTRQWCPYNWAGRRNRSLWQVKSLRKHTEKKQYHSHWDVAVVSNHGHLNWQWNFMFKTKHMLFLFLGKHTVGRLGSLSGLFQNTVLMRYLSTSPQVSKSRSCPSCQILSDHIHLNSERQQGTSRAEAGEMPWKSPGESSDVRLKRSLATLSTGTMWKEFTVQTRGGEVCVRGEQIVCWAIQVDEDTQTWIPEVEHQELELQMRTLARWEMLGEVAWTSHRTCHPTQLVPWEFYIHSQRFQTKERAVSAQNPAPLCMGCWFPFIASSSGFISGSLEAAHP